MPVGNHIERFREQCGEIGMFGIDDDPRLWTAAVPEFRGSPLSLFGTADFQGEIHAQTLERLLLILDLTASFAGLPGDTRRPMREHHRGIGLIPMLPPRSAATRCRRLAFLQQHIDRQRAGMDHDTRLIFLLAQFGEDRQIFQRGGIARRFPTGGDITQQPPHDLAAARLR